MRRLVGALQAFTHSDEYLAIMIWEAKGPAAAT
jgi:hypothetical protein